MEGVTGCQEKPPAVDGVHEAAPVAPPSSLSPVTIPCGAAIDESPLRAGAAVDEPPPGRVLAASASWERSPRGAREAPSSVSPSDSVSQSSNGFSCHHHFL